MKQGGRFGLIALLAGALLLTAGGAVTAVQELQVFAAGGISPASRFAALAEGAHPTAPSTLAKRVALDTCVEAISGLYGRMQPGDARASVFTHCLGEADAIAAEAPSLSYAWYTGALAAARLGDLGGFNTRMARAQATGPTEQGIAELRAALVEDFFGDASPEVLAGHAADLRLLVASGRGIDSISGRYVREPAFRERITAIVEAMPEADQARFVSRVRRAADRAVAP